MRKTSVIACPPERNGSVAMRPFEGVRELARKQRQVQKRLGAKNAPVFFDPTHLIPRHLPLHLALYHREIQCSTCPGASRALSARKTLSERDHFWNHAGSICVEE